MQLSDFLHAIKNNHPVQFNETIACITAYYDYHPTEFSNGIGADKLVNPAGSNEGSCKIFAFAQLHHLTPQQTLNLFGQFYHHDVLQHPHGTDHQNIRRFIQYGWKGIHFTQSALTIK